MKNKSCKNIKFDFTKLHTYSGYFNNTNKLLRSASGGAASAFAEAIINIGGIVIGASYSHDYRRAEYTCINNLDDLEKIKGSKYCETKKELQINGKYINVFSFIENKLNEGALILFIGLGCDVGALIKLCKVHNIDTEKLYVVDILCHGPTTPEVHNQYIDYIEKENNSKVTYFTVRYKKKGWTPPYIHAEFENGNVHEIPFSQSDYGYAFSIFSASQCYNCNFKGANHKGDVTIGDFWGLTQEMPGWNKNGVSIMFSRTAKGDDLINMIDRNSFHLENASTSFALINNSMYYKSRKKSKYYNKFEKNLKTRGLHYAVQHAKSIKSKVTVLLKKFLF